MAEERPDYEKEIAELAGEVAALRSILLALACEMPERAMYHIERTAHDFARETETTARQTQNRKWMDYRDGATNVCNEFIDCLPQRSYGLSQGAYIRTVQPYPIDPKEWVDQERGF